MNYPKVLVISNNSFSKTDSNGRTLGNFFLGWPKEKLAQFCLSSDGANYDICNNYYCITDIEALKGCLYLRKAKGRRLEGQKSNVGARGDGKKSAFRMLCRNIVWSSGVWHSEHFVSWLKAFGPEIILVMFSDASFILDIATRLSKELDIPLMMFNTEGYYFFKQNYFRTKTIMDWLWFPIYQHRFKKSVNNMMKRVDYSIYCNSLLQDDYCKVFGANSLVLFTTSTVEPTMRSYENFPYKCSYVGNLTFGRPRALLEIADVLQTIGPSWKLDVYGKALKKEDEELLKNHQGIVFHGFIGYEEMISVLRNSQILFHAEAQDERWHEALKYGFSTKIADSLSSGTCFVLYASEHIACAKYIKDTGAGWFASDKQSLKLCIEDIAFNPMHRNAVLEKAKMIAAQNHKASVNCSKFQEAINQAIESYRIRRAKLMQNLE